MSSADELMVTCPACGNLVTPLPIVFGLPGHELMAAAEAGEVELGGCVVTGSEVTFRCAACRTVFERGSDDDETAAFLSYMSLDFDE